jgi:hypothetical protein
MIMHHCKTISPSARERTSFFVSWATCQEHVIERIHGSKVRIHVTGTFHGGGPEWILNALPESRPRLNKDVNAAFYIPSLTHHRKIA